MSFNRSSYPIHPSRKIASETLAFSAADPWVAPNMLMPDPSEVRFHDNDPYLGPPTE